jgi:hypothetical protein
MQYSSEVYLQTDRDVEKKNLIFKNSVKPEIESNQMLSKICIYAILKAEIAPNVLFS